MENNRSRTVKKNAIPRVAAVHDLSGYGRSSLTIVLPVLSAMGINACPLPTAILSTQTSGFRDYVFHDLTDVMKQTLDHWKRLSVSFDGIYSGFLGSVAQIDIVKELIFQFRHKDSLISIDPVLGDEGVFYGPMNQDMVLGMKDLITKANLITPNYTEACFLGGREYSRFVSLEEAKDLLRQLASFGPDKVVITSIPLEELESFNTVLGYEKKSGRIWKISTSCVPASYPGTGDMFASVITAGLLLGNSLPASIDKAVHFVRHAIQNTYSCQTPQREGVLLEKSLFLLINPPNMHLCELVE